MCGRLKKCFQPISGIVIRRSIVQELVFTNSRMRMFMGHCEECTIFQITVGDLYSIGCKPSQLNEMLASSTSQSFPSNLCTKRVSIVWTRRVDSNGTHQVMRVTIEPHPGHLDRAQHRIENSTCDCDSLATSAHPSLLDPSDLVFLPPQFFACFSSAA